MASASICLFANTLSYPLGGGHHWVYLNWALGRRRPLGHPLIWLEGVDLRTTGSVEALDSLVTSLKGRLEPYGLADAVAVLVMDRGNSTGRWGGALPRAGRGR